MIAYLKGTVLKKLEKTIIVNTGSIGYRTHVTTPLWEKLEENQPIELFVYTKVREDEISLYGFENIQALEFFETLINVNGIGPKLGLELLSHDQNKIKNAIVTQNIAALSQIPGIGKKTAERIILELKNKLTLTELPRKHATIEPTLNEDTVKALMGLGYQRFEINRVLKNAPEEITQVEELVTYFLRNI